MVTDLFDRMQSGAEDSASVAAVASVRLDKDLMLEPDKGEVGPAEHTAAVVHFRRIQSGQNKVLELVADGSEPVALEQLGVSFSAGQRPRQVGYRHRRSVRHLFGSIPAAGDDDGRTTRTGSLDELTGSFGGRPQCEDGAGQGADLKGIVGWMENRNKMRGGRIQKRIRKTFWIGKGQVELHLFDVGGDLDGQRDVEDGLPIPDGSLRHVERRQVGYETVVAVNLSAKRPPNLKLKKIELKKKNWTDVT